MNTFSSFVATQLNESQQAAVTPRDGIFLVCAGAGSGKTRVITARMTNLILNHDVAASSIIALTFTNKAAREMKERIARFLPEGTSLPYVGTFHSYCLRLLKINSHLLPAANFTILDDSDQETLLRGILKKYAVQKKLSPRSVSSAISRLKNDASSQADISAHKLTDPLLQQIYCAYEEEKKRAHCYDFDDLLLETLNLFQTNEQFRTKYHSLIKHVLIDEYQDTNRVQHALLQSISKSPAREVVLDSLCVVGDEDQSIYSWRGATVTNIINFRHDFPSATTITIEQNYRSVQPILESANTVIEHNTQRNPKSLWSDRLGTDRLRLLTSASHYQEALLVALAAQATQRASSLDNFAVLYRSHYQSRALEEACIQLSIPYKIIGGTQFYDRQEIKDILSYARLAVNPFDRVAFNRCINTPSRSLGDKFLELFFTRADEQPFMNCIEIADDLIKQQLISGTKKIALMNFCTLMNTVQQLVTETASAYSIIDTIIQRTQYFSYLKESCDPEDARNRIDNIKELLNALQSLTDRGIISLSDFLDEVALLQEHSSTKNESSSFARLMTIHAAKGLEFDTVVITGLEEGILPSSQSIYQEETLEEERRLLYVALTRARERVLLLNCTHRSIFGQTQNQLASRFTNELPRTHVQHHDASYWNKEQATTYLRQWISGSAISHFQPAQAATPPHTFAMHRPEQSTKSPLSSWRLNQKVHHAIFGPGIIQTVEEKSNELVYLTIKFKTSTKKIASQFVQAV